MSDELELMRNLWDCCKHCEHEVNDPPHEIPCPEGCNDDE